MNTRPPTPGLLTLQNKYDAISDSAAVPYTLYGDLVTLTRLAKAGQDALLKEVAACCSAGSGNFAQFTSSLESVVSKQSVNTTGIASTLGVNPQDGSLGGATSGGAGSRLVGYLLNNGGIMQCKVIE